MAKPRKCEVCGHEWKSKFAYDWILLCPKCKVSGYHVPKSRSEPPEGRGEEKE